MSGVLLPVRQRGVAAMLKISRETEEQAGGRVMLWWNGDGAAPVLAHDDEALLMVRAQGPSSLVQMARSARDDDATRILCATAARLHKPRAEPRPALVPLTRWFDALLSGADSHGGIFTHSARTARELLTTPRDPAVLHGDIHHANVLVSERRAGSRSIRKACTASAASTTPISSATPTKTAHWRPACSRAAWRWWRRFPASKSGVCCNGFSRGPASRQSGCSKTATTRTSRRRSASSPLRRSASSSERRTSDHSGAVARIVTMS